MMITDTTMTALHSALDGLAQRQRVTAENVANINTPGYLAKRTEFESTLTGELADGESPTASSTVLTSSDPTNTNGNNVNLDTETVIQTETGLRYQLAISALNGKYELLTSALKTS